MARHPLSVSSLFGTAVEPGSAEALVCPLPVWRAVMAFGMGATKKQQQDYI